MDKKTVEALKCSSYPQCEYIAKHKIDVKITDEQMEKFRQDYRVIPLFEQKIQDYVQCRSTSMVRNGLMACRWRDRVCNAEVYSKKKIIFKFPRARDFHYLNYHRRYLPELTPDNRFNNRLNMRLGPGVDQYGQLPIPPDHHRVIRNPAKWKCMEKLRKKEIV